MAWDGIPLPRAKARSKAKQKSLSYFNHPVIDPPYPPLFLHYFIMFGMTA
jgi:hypothetical protein